MSLAILSFDYSGLSVGLAVPALLFYLMCACFLSFTMDWLGVWRRWRPRWTRSIFRFSWISALLFLALTLLYAVLTIRDAFWLQRQYNDSWAVPSLFLLPPLFAIIAWSSRRQMNGQLSTQSS
jgi:hypothetical protein